MSWHGKLNFWQCAAFCGFLLFSLCVSLSVFTVQQWPLRSNPLNNTIQLLQHSTARVIPFLSYIFSTVCPNCSSLPSQSFFIPLPSPALSYFLYSPFPAALPLTCYYVFSSSLNTYQPSSPLCPCIPSHQASFLCNSVLNRSSLASPLLLPSSQFCSPKFDELHSPLSSVSLLYPSTLL